MWRAFVVPAAVIAGLVGALAVAGCGGSSSNGETVQSSENAAETSKSGAAMKDESGAAMKDEPSSAGGDHMGG